MSSTLTPLAGHGPLGLVFSWIIQEGLANVFYLDCCKVENSPKQDLVVSACTPFMLLY